MHFALALLTSQDPHFLAKLLLWLAAAGLVSCSIFVVLAAVGAARFDRSHHIDTASGEACPGVTLLKPVCGLEPNLKANIESFFNQDYPQFQIVFGARDEHDAAIPVIREIQKSYPEVPVRFAFSGIPQRPNAKVCSLVKMLDAADHDYLIISDSDVEVTPDYIRHVITPLLDPAVGMVTCLYRGVPTGGIWSRLEALGMSVEMTSGVVVADLLEGMRFALSPTMAIRRDVLGRVGGFSSLVDYCADDYVLGRETYNAGYSVALSDYVVNHIIINRSFRSSIAHQVRWMKSTRFSRPLGHIGTGFTFAMPFGLLGLVAGLLGGQTALGIGLFLFAFVNRMVLAAIAGWGVVRDRNALNYSWLYPLRDLMGFFFWIASFTGRIIVWRDGRYRLEWGGKMTRIASDAPGRSASKSVAVDDLA